MKTLIAALILSLFAASAHAELPFQFPLLTGEFTAGVEGENQISITAYEDGTVGITTSGMLYVEPVVPVVVMNTLDQFDGKLILDIDGYLLTIAYEMEWTRYSIDLGIEVVSLTPVF